MRQGCNKNYNFSGKGGDYGKAPLITPPRLCCDDNRTKFIILSRKGRERKITQFCFSTRDGFTTSTTIWTPQPHEIQGAVRCTEKKTKEIHPLVKTNRSQTRLITLGKRNRRCEEGNPNVLRPTLKQHGTPVCARFA
jgi:hypothetical protein